MPGQGRRDSRLGFHRRFLRLRSSLTSRASIAHTVVGGALLAAFATTGWFPALVALPFLLGLLLAVPLCVITGRPDRAS